MKHRANIIFLLFTSFLFSDDFDSSRIEFSANNMNVMQESQSIDINNKLKATIYSAIIPGSGQYFVKEEKKKGILFFGLELIAWAGYFTYQDKAESYKADYQSYGDEHWELTTWVNHYYDWSNPDNEFFEIFANNQTQEYPDINEGSHHIDFSYIDDSGDRIFIRTNSEEFFALYENWDDSFELENEVIIFKDHHFYENIVKYNHFFAGWDDQDQITMEVNSNGYKTAFSPNKTSYRNLYNKSIHNYKVRDDILSFIFINHFVSMLDGLVFNSNNNLSENFSVSYDYNSTINFHQAKLIVKLK